MWFYHIYFIQFLQSHLIYSPFVTSTECSSGSALTGKLSSVLVNSYGWVFNSYLLLVLIIKREIRTDNNEPKLIFSQRNRSCYFHSQQHRSQLQILNNIVKKCQFTSWWRWCPIEIWSMPFHISWGAKSSKAFTSKCCCFFRSFYHSLPSACSTSVDGIYDPTAAVLFWQSKLMESVVFAYTWCYTNSFWIFSFWHDWHRHRIGEPLSFKSHMVNQAVYNLSSLGHKKILTNCNHNLLLEISGIVSWYLCFLNKCRCMLVLLLLQSLMF